MSIDQAQRDAEGNVRGRSGSKAAKVARKQMRELVVGEFKLAKGGFNRREYLVNPIQGMPDAAGVQTDIRGENLIQIREDYNKRAIGFLHSVSKGEAPLATYADGLQTLIHENGGKKRKNPVLSLQSNRPLSWRWIHLKR